MTTTFPCHLMPETMTTQRLRLRAPVQADASRIAMFIGDWDVAKMLARVPHPYREADAIAWIGSVDRSKRANYVLVHANGVIGAVGIEQRADGVAELGYWLAKPFWGRGLVTEAATAVINAARVCGPRAAITCSHFDDNPASERVIQKLGFVATGEQQARSVSRNADVRLLTYRLPVVIPTRATAATSPPELTPA
jgi:[ribosomal protein S5]-alanine N-acetyltransferase